MVIDKEVESWLEEYTDYESSVMGASVLTLLGELAPQEKLIYVVYLEEGSARKAAKKLHKSHSLITNRVNHITKKLRRLFEERNKEYGYV